MSFLKEFKEFISEGNVIDLAVGVIIGGAFGKIVDSFVSDILMPPISIFMGADYTELKLKLKAATTNTKAITLNYGEFLQRSIDFLIVALALFLIIKGVNSFKRKEKSKEKDKSDEVILLEGILKELKKQNN